MNVWFLLDRVGIVLGIVLALPVFWSWIILLGYRRRQNRLLQEIRKQPGDRPIALIVNIGEGDIANQVRRYLESQDSQMDIKLLSEKTLSQDTIAEFTEKIRAIRAEFMEKSIDKIHLFYRGPVAGALLVGDTLSNGFPVLVYHLDKQKGYECWGPLTQPLIY